MLQQRKEAAMKREKSLSQAFSQQVSVLPFIFTVFFFFVFTELCVLGLTGSLPKSQRITVILLKVTLFYFNRITTPLRICQIHSVWIRSEKCGSKHVFMSVDLVPLLKGVLFDIFETFQVDLILTPELILS
jgi:hypothetical protein